MGGMLRWQSCSTSDFPLKRSKVAAACQPCRTKKMRCDGRQPCSRCMKDDKTCEYRPSNISHNNSNNNNQHSSDNKSNHTHSRHSSLSPKFQWSRLKKLSFHQDLYAALNLSASPISSKSGKLPPLLLEFYHLTAQPITIWARMHVLFLKWYRLQKSPSLSSIRIPADVAKEAVHLFFKHNSLYTLFIDPADITSALDLDPFFPSTITTTNDKSVHPAGSLLLDTILALTFLAAGQTIGSDILLDVAGFFYDTVHQRWLNMTFPSNDTATLSPATISSKSSFKSDNNDTSSALKLLTQTAILLIHFQCTAICEEQAYMTSRIAQGCLERLLSMGQIKSETQQQPLDHTPLQYTLHAWQVWLVLYLYDGQSLISPIAKNASSITPPILPLSSSPLCQQQNQEKQLWTWTVLTQYAMFMESLLKANQNPNMTIQGMMDKSQALDVLSTMNKKSAASDPTTSTTCPEQLVGLYHTMLNIQLFSTQWLPHLDFFILGAKSEQQQQQQQQQQQIKRIGDRNKDSGDNSGDINDDMDLPKKICIETSQRIIQMVSAMMMTGQYITAHRSSSPLLLFIRYRALCFASAILIPLGQQQWMANGTLPTYLDDTLHQLKQIIEKDIQVWPMARQCLYYLQQRMPSHFDIQDTTTTEDGFFSNYDADGSNGFILDYQQGRPLQTTNTTAAMMMTSSLPTHRHWNGMKKRDHIDQEQLNKLSQLSKYGTMKKRNNDALLYNHQQPLLENTVYSRKRHQTHPAATTTTTTNYWLPSYSLDGGSYLMLGNEGHSSMLLSASSSTGSSASTSTALSIPSGTTAMTASPSISAVSSTFALSTAPSMVPMPYPTSLQQVIVSQSVMTSIPTASIPSTTTDQNNGSFDLVQQASTASTYQHHAMVQQQTMTAMGMTPTVSSSISDTSHFLPSVNDRWPLTTTTTWQYPSRQLLHDTFTDSIMETLHATHDQPILHGNSHPLPPAPASSPIDTPTPSYLDDVHLQAVSRGLAHHASSMSLTRTASVDSNATTNNDLISNDRHTQEWLYFLYHHQQQQQQQRQHYQQQPPPESSAACTDDPFMLFSSPLPSIPRK